MNMITVVPVRTEDEYQAALSCLEMIFDAEEGTPEFDELDVLSVLIERFEQARPDQQLLVHAHA